MWRVNSIEQEEKANLKNDKKVEKERKAAKAEARVSEFSEGNESANSSLQNDADDFYVFIYDEEERGTL